MEENEPKEHHHSHKREPQLSMPLAIVLGAFISATAIIIVQMPRRITTVTTQNTATDGANSQYDAATINTMVDHVIASKNQTPVVAVSASDHILGSAHPKITLIEYSDLECPFCKNFDSTMNKVIQNYGDRVAWVYRHFPLDCVDNTSDDCTPLHPKARHEAVASECAFEQGGNDAFWQYMTRVFAITPSNNRLDPAQLTSIAQDMNLKMDTFNTCLSTDKYASVVSTDAKEGLKSKVQGTPETLIVDQLGNTYTIAGAYPYEVVSGAIDRLVK